MSPWLEPLILVFNQFVIIYFVTVGVIYTLLLGIALSAILHFSRHSFSSDYRQIKKSDMSWPVSILVPARNEERTIVQTVHSLLGVDYPEFEIIVVNDGSTDDTLEELVRTFSLVPADEVYRRRLATAPIRTIYVSREFPHLRVVDKVRGGKPDALNAGINLSRYPLYCSIDADCIIERQALARLAKPFMERPQETVAAGGIVRIVNGCTVRDGQVAEVRLPKQLLPLLQVIEYLRGFLTGRLGWSGLHSLLIISGAFGVYVKEAVIEAGGYSSATDTEDMELVVRLHRHRRSRGQPCRMELVPDPVCWTEVPGSWWDLIRQRIRWHRGMIQTLLLHRQMMFNPRYGAVGLLAYPYFCFIEMFGPLVEAFGYLLLAAAYGTGLLSGQFLILFLTLALLFGTFLSVAAVLLEELSFRRYRRWSDLGKLIVLSFVENLGYRQLLAFVKLCAFVDFVLGRRRWGKVARAGFRQAHSG